MNSRRKFLQQLSTAPLVTMPLTLLGGNGKITSLPTFTRPDDEHYWEMVKKQFAVPDNLIMMNAANLCPAPFSVNERVMEFTRALSRDVSFSYRAVFAELRKQSLSQLAEFTGTDTEELGITRNTSESNCIVVQGLDFKPGDEIIIWDQNHPSNEAIWLNRAKRYGFIVKKVAVPTTPASKRDLADPFVKAITPKTKLIAFSHISNLSGIALPAKEICIHANSKGIMTLIDGAQSLGMMELNLHDIGCSFYTASTHKWLMGPFENGLLYVRKEFIPKIWPNIIGGGWKEAKTVDENICILGQRNETSTAALPECLQFHKAIGIKNIENRVVRLNSYLKEKIQSRIPAAVFVTPLQSELSGGIVIFNIPGKDTRDIVQKLYDKHGIAGAPAGGVRLSPHIYNTLEDLDRVVEALTTLT